MSSSPRPVPRETPRSQSRQPDNQVLRVSSAARTSLAASPAPCYRAQTPLVAWGRGFCRPLLVPRAAQGPLAAPRSGAQRGRAWPPCGRGRGSVRPLTYVLGGSQRHSWRGQVCLGDRCLQCGCPWRQSHVPLLSVPAWPPSQHPSCTGPQLSSTAGGPQTEGDVSGEGRKGAPNDVSAFPGPLSLGRRRAAVEATGEGALHSVPRIRWEAPGPPTGAGLPHGGTEAARTPGGLGAASGPPR